MDLSIIQRITRSSGFLVQNHFLDMAIRYVCAYRYFPEAFLYEPTPGFLRRCFSDYGRNMGGARVRYRLADTHAQRGEYHVRDQWNVCARHTNDVLQLPEHIVFSDIYSSNRAIALIVRRYCRWNIRRRHNGHDLTSPLDVSYLPVFTLQNKSTGIRVQTTDPGRALITGLWADVGKVKGPILRGLAARAPYFHNASASSLSDVVTFYDKRFNVGFTAQEKADLVAFLNSL
jgi:hypothetical protein